MIIPLFTITPIENHDGFDLVHQANTLLESVGLGVPDEPAEQIYYEALSRFVDEANGVDPRRIVPSFVADCIIDMVYGDDAEREAARRLMQDMLLYNTN